MIHPDFNVVRLLIQGQVFIFWLLYQYFKDSYFSRSELNLVVVIMWSSVIFSKVKISRLWQEISERKGIQVFGVIAVEALVFSQPLFAALECFITIKIELFGSLSQLSIDFTLFLCAIWVRKCWISALITPQACEFVGIKALTRRLIILHWALPKVVAEQIGTSGQVNGADCVLLLVFCLQIPTFTILTIRAFVRQWTIAFVINDLSQWIGIALHYLFSLLYGLHAVSGLNLNFINEWLRWLCLLWTALIIEPRYLWILWSRASHLVAPLIILGALQLNPLEVEIELDRWSSIDHSSLSHLHILAIFCLKPAKPLDEWSSGYQVRLNQWPIEFKLNLENWSGRQMFQLFWENAYHLVAV